MRTLLSSHRRRRRLGWFFGCLIVAGVITAIAVKFPNTGTPFPAPTPGGPVRAEPESKPVRLSRDAKRAALRTASNFIRTAVLRRHLDQSWRLAGPGLKTGYTRRQWRTGNIPVVPYPAQSLGSATSRVSYSYANLVGLEVLLTPKPRSNVQSTTFVMELKSVGSASRRHWLVDSWTPELPPGAVAAARSPGSTPVAYRGALSATWLLVPVGLIGLLLLIPAATLARVWYVGRRAGRAHRERDPSYHAGAR